MCLDLDPLTSGRTSQLRGNWQGFLKTKSGDISTSRVWRNLGKTNISTDNVDEYCKKDTYLINSVKILNICSEKKTFS